ncbi:MAG: hypothetical protein II007_07740 [Gammaproteobacteria bacterium]|nr:hypothetical protein [Gammaproteobacteria bacterium]
MDIFNRRKSWRDEYIGILQHGPNQSQMKFALELINDGYADGMVSREAGIGDRAPYVRWQGINTKGRLFLDDLIEQERKASVFLQNKNLCLSPW